MTVLHLCARLLPIGRALRSVALMQADGSARLSMACKDLVSALLNEAHPGAAKQQNGSPLSKRNPAYTLLK